MLLLTRHSRAAPFSGYLAEILAVEGFLGYDVVDLTDRPLTGALLDGQDLIITAAMPLEAAERDALSLYVEGGGRLIAIRPPVEMAPLFGLEPRNLLLRRGHYLQFDETHAPLGARSTDNPLQVHAEADCYAVKDAEVAAWFCWSTGGRRAFPAAAYRSAGRGAAAMLAFDLAESTLRHHQGLPEQSSTGACPDPGANGMYKPDAMFIGQLDVTRATIPQADLQQRLLTALVDQMLPAPVPRLWYFPDGEPCLAFLNGDSDGMDTNDLGAVLEILEPRGGYYTCYVMDEEPLSPADEALVRARSHSFGKHVWAGPQPTLEVMAAAVEEQIAGFRRRYGYVPLSHRGHCLIWPGWTEMAGFLARAGVRMDSNFVGIHCGHGYLTGSGLPVKFLDPRGRPIDLYEQSTQWEDDVAIGDLYEQLSHDQAITQSLVTLREAQDEYHTVVNFNFHPIHTRKERLNTREWITAVADACRARQIRMIGGDEWVRFNDARRHVAMTAYTSDRFERRLRFRLQAREPVPGLTLSLPAAWDGAAIERATLDGSSLPLRPLRIHQSDRTLIRLTLPAGESGQIEVSWK